MKQPHLFLLKASFLDPSAGVENQGYHCPDCARIEGLLSYFPALRERVVVQYVEFSKPRAAIVAYLGEQYQSCPVLVATEELAAQVPECSFQVYEYYYFLNTAEAITEFLASAYGISRAHP